ncbi:MAG: MBL fold metallo-hydrolase [Bacteroidales bacterium]|nr:MBL fold metallo-hydrolase [Bacteroidales bacterium]
MNIQSFTVNGFAVNSYLLYDDSNECLVIDPGFYEQYEKDSLTEFITRNKLVPVKVLNTHCHVDHILGNRFVCEHYHIPLSAHKEDQFLLDHALEMGEIFGLKVQPSPPVDIYLNHGDTVRFGNSELKVIHTPGHSPGSISFYNKADSFVIVGDVLFSGSIGRTDLPKGNYETLISSILNELLILPAETAVFPGHGPSTTIRNEHDTNPFLQ